MDKKSLKLFSKDLHRELHLCLRVDDTLRAVVYVGPKRDTIVVFASGSLKEFRWDSINEHPGFWLGKACFDVTLNEARQIAETFGFPLPQKKEQAA